MLKNILMWTILGITIFSVFNKFEEEDTTEITYSEFISSIKKSQITDVEISGNIISGNTVNGESFTTYNPGDLGLMGDLLEGNVNIKSSPPKKDSFLKQLLISIAPMLLLIGIIIYSMRGAGSALPGGNPLSFGKSKAKLIDKGSSDITFKDVAGVDEAKEEVEEVVQFLSDPDKFTSVGGKIPKGVLLVGPPGTGKTLLAKAIAGEAQVPFFFISGSDFVEMFVGVGASRVRDMFEQAKKHAPCIIFIDEIDAVGRHRGAGMGGGNDEREQTLNQMLVEMDGFKDNEGIIIIAATNRPDVLDGALLRPGRFDRQVTVGLPDIKGRDAILKVHMRKLPIAKNVKSISIAKGTPGFSGADLANLVNEAALITAKNDKEIVGMHELEKAKDKIMMGSERKSMVMDEAEKKMTAYHEAGHAIVGRLMPEHDPVYKVSIIPRGRALGVTMFLPAKDNYSISKLKLNSQIATLFGGRIAEELIYGKDAITTGASNDIERATEIASSMVKVWGMSEKLGPLSYDDKDTSNSYPPKQKHFSEKISEEVDDEIRNIINKNYKNAYQILSDNKDILESMTAALIEVETIDEGQIDDLMARKPISTSAEIIDSEEMSEELGVGSQKEEATEEIKDEKSGRTIKKFV